MHDGHAKLPVSFSPPAQLLGARVPYSRHEKYNNIESYGYMGKKAQPLQSSNLAEHEAGQSTDELCDDD